MVEYATHSEEKVQQRINNPMVFQKNEKEKNLSMCIIGSEIYSFIINPYPEVKFRMQI